MQRYFKSKKKVAYKRKRSPSAVGNTSNLRKYARWATKPKLLKMDLNPFPAVYKTTLTWHPPANTIGGVTQTNAQIKLNSIYDPDPSTTFFNGQPLYFDQICSADGPYKKYIVTGWRGSLTVINATGITDTVPFDTVADAVECYFQHGSLFAGDADTVSEQQSIPNREVALLSPPKMGNNNKHVFKFQGKTKDFVSKPAFDSTCAGFYNSDPSTVVYGSFSARSLNTKVLYLFVMLQIEFDVEFFVGDGTAS